jgi:hypothetical protein
MSVYRAITFKVLKKTDKREQRIVIRDHSHDRTFSIDYPEEEGMPPAKELVAKHLESCKIKVLKSNTWIEPQGYVFLTSNMSNDIVADA